MTPFKAKILALIREYGPMTVGQYMHIALMDPEHGYYMCRDPLGAAGDFITAPEVSQMFGELIGLFFVQAWEDRGRPERFHLVEMGPGRGTLMADMLRAAKIRPKFLAAAQATLIEASPALRAAQEKTLAGFRVCWAEGLDSLDGAPVFLIANEFLDALPAQQWVQCDGGWRGRTVAAKGDDLVFALTEDIETNDFGFPDASDGAVLEIGVELIATLRKITDRIVTLGGVALIIDYGHPESHLGDTFQAIKGHAYADPLSEPGEADLTFHVDFGALRNTAGAHGGQVFGPITQKQFLETLGIHMRAGRLKRAKPEQTAAIDAALHRLTDPAAMGALFKVMAISDRPLPLPGFAC